MMNVVLTGHGEFSIGLKNALEMIAGEQAAFEAVPFLDGEATDVFEQKLRDTIADLKKDNESVVVLADLVGGTPYKTAVTILHEDQHARVVGGVNLAMLLELLMMRLAADDVDALVNQVINSGKDAIAAFETPVPTEEEDDAFDGI